jgi:hypothetical protein
MADNGTMMLVAGVALAGVALYYYSTSSDDSPGALRPTQILYSDAARIPDGSLLAGTRAVHPNRTDIVGRNGVIYVGYFNGGQLPSSTKSKVGFP